MLAGRGAIAAPLRSMVGDGGLLMRTKATANATLSNLMSFWRYYFNMDENQKPKDESFQLIKQ
jgi:hypothetical protein